MAPGSRWLLLLVVVGTVTSLILTFCSTGATSGKAAAVAVATFPAERPGDAVPEKAGNTLVTAVIRQHVALFAEATTQLRGSKQERKGFRGLWHPSHWPSVASYGRAWGQAADGTRRLAEQLFALDLDSAFVWPSTKGPRDPNRRVAVVHLRCSDVPMIRHAKYHLPTRAFWEFAARRLAGHQDVHVLSCGDFHAWKVHRGTGVCSRVAEAVVAFLRGRLGHNGTTVHEPECLSRGDTLRAFHQSTTLVAAVASSFAFVVGIAKRRRFVTPLLVSEAQPLNQVAGLPAAVPWTMCGEPPLYHRHVPSYAGLNYSALLLGADRVTRGHRRLSQRRQWRRRPPR